MERFTDKAITIYEAMQNIKNEKYVMPAFQRQYVWSLEQVENCGIQFCLITLFQIFCFGILIIQM